MQAHASLTLWQAKTCLTYIVAGKTKSASRPDAFVQDESFVLSQRWQCRRHVYQ